MESNGKALEGIRSDFPVLGRKMRGHRLVYLDSAATSLKPGQVIQAMDAYYQEYTANIHRGVYWLSEESTRQYEAARDKVAQFIGASDPSCCIFTRGTTESLNLVAYSWGEENIRAGDDIVLTIMEHHSNLVPWQQLARRKGANLRWIEILEDGTLDLSGLDELLSGRPRLVAFTWVSNVFGTINPVAELCRRARAAGATVVVDGAQGVPHLPCRVEELGCDFLAFSGHKMLGPTGIGVLWGRRELLEEMQPFHYGGDMISEVWRERSTWAELPAKFEAGTPNIAGAIGLGAAAEYLGRLGMDQVRRHEEDLLGYAYQRLGSLEGIQLLGPADLSRRSGVISFYYKGIHPHDLATLLDRQGVCVRAGHHCCMPLMREIGLTGTTRASLYIYNNREDIDQMAEALLKASEVFTGVSLH
ncbi:MAG TPA: cysteine desulfurase [Candidatus Nitrosotenuis sp.]|jgi:cysteine desulfurase/selenocysteine lyase|nr:cysteine desulfurase [Candidatus Nitrosotenuis sp.]